MKLGTRNSEIIERGILTPNGIIWDDVFGYVRESSEESSKTVSVEEVNEIIKEASLRDYFAAKAMMGIMSDCNNMKIIADNSSSQDEFFSNMAEDSYRIADAMLKARKL